MTGASPIVLAKHPGLRETSMNIHPLVAIVTLLALLVYFYMSLRVGQGRTKYNVPAPAVTGNPDFERA